MKSTPILAFSILLLTFSSAARAVTFDWATVGNPGNAGELSGEGAGGYGPDAIVGGVDHTYRIGKYEVTAGQYTEFLNAVAATDPYGLYNTNMWSNTYGCKIERTGTDGSYSYSVAADRANRPVNYVSFFDAMRFANWLHNGQPRTAGSARPRIGRLHDQRRIERSPQPECHLLHPQRGRVVQGGLPQERRGRRATTGTTRPAAIPHRAT